ncbi:MAG: TonB-dependent receptor [Nitrosomonadales bacterium]|nr:TonB-dependent receptor [Nitrosomonadales bacterium]
MKTRLNKGRLLLALGCIFGLTNAAGAAESGEEVELGEVVVTATRTSATLSAAPAAVTVVNAQDIETKNASRLGDVLDQVPSLYLRGGALGQSQGTIGTSGMSLRGIDQTRTLILLDGQPIQDAGSGKVNWRVPFIEDIARVEVVPGAFSALYGSNAIGGVINIITKQPDKREFTAKIKKGWSAASGEDASIYFRDKMENGLGFAGGLGYQNRDSYVNDFVVKAPSCPPAPAPCTPGTPVTGAQAITTREGVPTYLVGDLGTAPWNSTNATAKLFYDLNARDKIYAGVNHQETRQGYIQFNTYLSNTATGAPVSSGTLSINGQRVALTNYDFTLFSFLPLHESATRYFVGYDGTIGNDYLLKADLGKIERTYNFTLASPAATWNSGAGTLSDTPNDGLDGTVQLSFPLGNNHLMVTGLALHQDSVNQQIYTLFNWRDPGSKTAVNSGYNGHSTTTSIFAQDEISATDALKVYLGGRWDDWETRGNNFSNIVPAGTMLYPTRSVSAFSPKVSAVYKPTAITVLRASFGKSFRAPTNQDLYVTTTSRGRTTAGDPNLQPERGTTWEVGGEFHFTENTKVTATYYDTRLSSLIYLMQVSTTNSLRINAGKAKVNGIELGATAKLARWLELDANYAYIDSKMLENTTDPLSVGKRLTDSPRNIAGIGLTAQQGAWSGTLNARYVSHIFWNAQNTDIVEGVPGSYDAHTMVNAKLGYAFSKMVKGSVAVNNLLDKKAYSYFLLPGRNVTAEADFSF